MTNYIKSLLVAFVLTITGLLMSGCDEVALKKIQIVGLPSETIVVGQTFELNVVFEPDNATDKRVEWWTPQNNIIRMEQISDEFVKIEAINVGSAMVYVRSFDGNLTDSVQIDVMAGTLSLRFQGSVNNVVTRQYNAQPQSVLVNQAYDGVRYLYRLQGESEYTEVAPTNAGTYDIRAEVDTVSYQGYCEGVLNILPQTITIQAINKEISYGDEDVALTYRTVGELYDDELLIQGALTRQEGINAGNYAIYESQPFELSGDNSENYVINFVEGSYYIQPAEAQVSVSAPATYYGLQVGNINYSVTGLKYDDTKEDLNINIKVPSDAKDVGLYTLECLYDNSNYNLTFTNNRLNILPAPIVVTIQNETKKYKTEDPQDYTYTIYNSRNKEDTTKLFYDDVLSVTFNRAVGEDVGNYSINATVGGPYASNYNISITKGTLTITPRQIHIQAGDATKRFGQSDPEFTYSFVDGYDEVVDNEISITFNRSSGENVGNYEITPIASQDKSNYVITTLVGNLEITPALVSIKVDDATKIYADTDPTYQFSLLEGSDSIYDGNTLEFDYIRVEGEDVGNYTVSIVVKTADPNYQITTSSGNLEIVARRLVFNVNDISMRYYQGYNLEDLTFTLDITKGDVNVENINIADYYQVTVPYQNNVGEYPLSYQKVVELPNYEITFVGGHLIINKAEIVIKLKDYTTYYGLEPTFTFEYAEGSDIMGDVSEGADEFTFTVPSEYYEIMNVGQYDIMGQVSQPNDNYNILVLSGKYTINKCEIYASVNNVQTTYGVTPQFTHEISEVKGQIVDGEIDYQYSCDGVDVGQYVINIELLQQANNYILYATAGQLDIVKAKIIFNIDAKTFKYGEDKEFTYSIDESSDSIINNELTITLSGDNTAVGEYDIEYTVTELNGKNNYDVTVNNATYTIIKRNYVIQISDITKYEGEDDGSYQWTLDATSDRILSEDFNQLGIVFSREEGETPGQYIISGTAQDSDHYTITILSGTLTILEAELE